MSQGRIPPLDEALIARSAIWLKCPDCDHTSRVLAVMAGRVLQERGQCPGCLSTRAPHMRLVRSGAHIPASEAHHAPWDEEEESYLRAWIEGCGRQRNQHWLGRFGRLLLARFSRTRRGDARVITTAAADDHGLAFPAEDKLS